MNFLFGLLPLIMITGVWAAIVVVLKKLVENQIITPYFHTTLKHMNNALLALCVIVVTFSSFNTFGPRVGLDVNRQIYTPQNRDSEIVPQKDYVDSIDRRGMFEERLNKEPVNKQD